MSFIDTDAKVIDTSSIETTATSVVAIFAVPVIATAIFLLVIFLPLEDYIPDERYRILAKVILFFIIIFIVDRIISLSIGSRVTVRPKTVIVE